MKPSHQSIVADTSGVRHYNSAKGDLRGENLRSNLLNHFCQNLAIETKETCVNIPAIITAIFGVFVIFGGVMGYVKAASKASLTAGSITGGLLLLSALLVANGTASGAILGMFVSLLLVGQFGPSLRKKFKVMPNLLVVILGIITFCALLFSVLQ